MYLKIKDNEIKKIEFKWNLEVIEACNNFLFKYG